MAKVLFIKSNDRPSDVAISNKMYDAFLASYKESNGIEPTPEEHKAAATVNHYLDQFLASDKIVFAFPLWNLTVPAPLITYVSYLTQAGKTFKYTSDGVIGLAGNKKVALLTARGGDYSSETMQPMEMALKYMKTILGFWGIRQPEVVVIEGHAKFMDRATEIIETGLGETAIAATNF